MKGCTNSKRMERIPKPLLDEIKKCSNGTQQFLYPILFNPLCHKILMSCIDLNNEKSFEDWVWDPIIRKRLEELIYIQKNGNLSDINLLNETYDASVEEYSNEENNVNRSIEQSMELCVNQRLLGEATFKAGDFSKAIKAYKKALDYLEPHVVGDSESIIELNSKNNLTLEVTRSYASCCNNIALCYKNQRHFADCIKYVNKALVIDPYNIKSYYLKSHCYMLEHRHDEAKETLLEGLDIEPGHKHLLYLQALINKLERQNSSAERLKQLQEINQKKLETRNGNNDAFSKEEYDKIKEELKAKKIAFLRENTPLPSTNDNGDTATSRLNTYFSKIKAPLHFEFVQKYDPSYGQSPLFGCRVYGYERNEVLGYAEATSKKEAKNLASKISIDKLWKERKATNESNLDEMQQITEKIAKHVIDDEEEPEKDQTEDAPTVKYPMYLHLNEYDKSNNPIMVLNEWKQKKWFNANYDFTFEEQRDESGEPVFKCFGILDGVTVGSQSAKSKKLARNLAGRLVLEAVVSNSHNIWNPIKKPM